MASTALHPNRKIAKFTIGKQSYNDFFENVKSSPLGENWPVVYLLHNDNFVNGDKHEKLLYIGETTSAVRRMQEHFSAQNKNFKDRAKLSTAHIIFDDTFNKSAILDIEQELIQMFSADSSNYSLQNKNEGQSSQHQYFERDDYQVSLRQIWEELRSKEIGMARDSYEDVRNSNLFKYSPYVALTEEQEQVCDNLLSEIIDSLVQNTRFNGVIEGLAGTGKTVVLIKVLSELVRLSRASQADLPADSGYSDEDALATRALYEKLCSDKLKKTSKKDLKIAYIVPISELLPTFKKVIKAVCGDDSVVMTATEVANSHDKYDVIFVDEAHRLGTINKFGANKDPYKKACKNALGVEYIAGQTEKYSELDWILAKCKRCIFVYDKNQKVRNHQSITDKHFESDVLDKTFTKRYRLKLQMRCKTGEKYAEFLDNLFNNNIKKSSPRPPFKGYDLRYYDDIAEMTSDINAFNAPGRCGLSRVTAGYGWEWKTKDKNRKNILKSPHEEWDIDIDGNNYFWNAKNGDFIFNADQNEIGCVHTVQGFDLNYVGVIFGPEIDYDKKKGITVDKRLLFDTGTNSKHIEDRLLLTIRAYQVLMARGIRGCYVYAYNPGMKEYLKKHIPSVQEAQSNLDATADGLIEEVVGLNISLPEDRQIENSIEVNKQDVDALLNGTDINNINKLGVNGTDIFVVSEIKTSDDGEYYIFDID